MSPTARSWIARYGVVVLSVNVSVLLYAPVRSASLAPIDCLKSTVRTSLDAGPVHVTTVVGAESRRPGRTRPCRS